LPHYAPHFQSYAEEFKGKISFLRVNIAEHLSITPKYGVPGTPTFKFFCKDHPFQDYVDEMYASLIKKMVEDGLQNSEQCVGKVTWIYPRIMGYT
jgi:thiol-disulfide isomerase/thioredoxin